MSLDSAITYARSLADRGIGVDQDGAYGYQCKDLYDAILLIFCDIQIMWGNASDIPRLARQNGLTYIEDAWGVNPKRGDLVVYSVSGHNYGHVGLVIEDSDGVTIKTIEQNVDGNSDFLVVGGPARYCTRKFDEYGLKVIGWVRPPYKDEPKETVKQEDTSLVYSKVAPKNVNGDLYSGLITSSRPEIFWGGGTRNTSAIKYIVIHGTATTRQQAVWDTWRKGSNYQASAHYVVDKNEIIGCVGENYVAWHSGGVATITNANSLGIEHMNSSIGNISDANTYLFDPKTIDTGAKLVAELCHRYGITPSASTIVPHRQVSATACPQTLNMSDYIAKVQQYYNQKPATTTATAPKPSTVAPSTPSKPAPTTSKPTTPTPAPKPATATTNTTVQGSNGGHPVGGSGMYFTYNITDSKEVSKDTVFFYNSASNTIVKLTHPDQLAIVRQVYKDNNGKDMPHYEWSVNAPWYFRFIQATRASEETAK